MKLPTGDVCTASSSHVAIGHFQSLSRPFNVPSAPFAYRHWPVSPSPQYRAVLVPPLAAYSHSDSLSNRYDAPVLRDSQ